MRTVLFILSLFLICPTIQAEQIELFSKEDARVSFSMSKTEWNNNVISIEEAGVGIAKGKLTDGLMLVTVVPTGYIAINPYYETEAKPTFLSVTIGYKEPYSSLMSVEELNEALKVARQQLLPEYDLSSEVEKIEGGFHSTFIYAGITEN